MFTKETAGLFTSEGDLAIHALRGLQCLGMPVKILPNGTVCPKGGIALFWKVNNISTHLRKGQGWHIGITSWTLRDFEIPEWAIITPFRVTIWYPSAEEPPPEFLMNLQKVLTDYLSWRPMNYSRPPCNATAPTPSGKNWERYSAWWKSARETVPQKSLVS